jgi:hypothetical protein
MSVISATWEANIGRITVQDQPGKVVLQNRVKRARWDVWLKWWNPCFASMKPRV